MGMALALAVGVCITKRAEQIMSDSVKVNQ